MLSDISIVGSHQFDDERNIVKFGPVKRSAGAQTTLRVLIKGPHRRDVRLSVKEFDPADVLSSHLGEPTEINNGAVFMYPLTVEVRKNAQPVERLGPTRRSFGKIMLETTHPTTKTINIYVSTSWSSRADPATSTSRKEPAMQRPLSLRQQFACAARTCAS